ncbi:hypothetical protein J5N97_004491 [Dioscorea zingiberensis]|uniref:Uncharacterized protein n=1 Tax=Dioscorea zingiberensis TaxID=325984 RepID=A0A9D5D686_9LILI|nr:hypothetical protein J5N97_004491 [Dioscorea zingiberensis]
MEVVVGSECLGETNGGEYPIYFGIACAFAALRLVGMEGLGWEHRGWCHVSELMLRGSAQLLGLLVERAQRKVGALEEKIRQAENEVREMKLRRSEDAKANEKVVAIFATHEQSWIAERKRLGLQIQSMARELRAAEGRIKEAVEERERVIRVKDEELDGELKKRRELEERVKMAEEVAEELGERVKKEAEEHSAELWKHKTAFMELVSDQRQLEAEMGRVLRQAEAAKRELEEAAEQKEEAAAMVDKLSDEILKLQKDAEQKDKILSAMLRKSKIDSAEKQMLLKEVKISKAKKKQAEMESDRWRSMCESRHKKSSTLSSRALPLVEAGSSRGNNHTGTLLLLEGHHNEFALIKRENAIAETESFDQYSSEGNDEIDDMQQLRDWVRMEAEKYAMVLEQRHYAEIEAFTEQMRLKDEKLEAFRWQLLSVELESKQLQSHIEGLDGTISQFRDENLRLEGLLSDREKELKLLREQFDFYVQHFQKNSLNYTASSELMDVKKKPREKEQEMQQIMELKKMEKSSDSSSMTDFASPNNQLDERAITCVNEFYAEQSDGETESPENPGKSFISITKNSKEIEEERVVSIDPGHIKSQNNFRGTPNTPEQTLTKNSSWKMDIHALGISYKIKRLKQQLLVVEKLTGEQAMKQSATANDSLSITDGPNKRKTGESKQQFKGLLLVISLLNKQVKRYQSLEEKTDELCRKMNESYRTVGSRDQFNNGPTKDQTETLQRFLEETFQLQRFMVATGQKLTDIEAKVTCSFVGSVGLDESSGFNMSQFADIVKNLFKEVQRGLELRIARIIGDLEGTLACDGILYR